jgi:hypothetical protein
MSRRDSSRPGGLKWSAAVAAGGAICLSAFVASAGAPAGGAAAARPRAAQGALPDLQVSQTRLRSSLILSQRTFSANSCSLVEGCVGAAGARRTLEFDTQIMNLGNADVVLGTPASRPDLFTFSQCHGHYHMNDSLDYSLARGGTDTVGAYDAAAGTFFLNNENKAGEASLAFAYGPTGLAWVAQRRLGRRRRRDAGPLRPLDRLLLSQEHEHGGRGGPDVPVRPRRPGMGAALG